MLRRRTGALAAVYLCLHCSSGPPVSADSAASPDAADAADAADTATDAARDGDASTTPPVADAALPPPVTRSDGTTLANFACNHHFTDPPAQPVAPHAFRVSAFYGESAFAPIAGATVTLIDPATGLAGSNPVFTSDAMGATSVPLAGNARVAWQVHPALASGVRCDPCLDGYVYNYRAPPNERATIDVVPTYAVEIDWWHGLSSGLGTTPLVLGTVTDCDGAVVQNAQVHVGDAPVCSQAPGVYPCVAYRAEHGVDVSATATRATGVFIVVGGEPGPLSIRVEGRTSAAQATTSVLGSLDVVTFAQSLAYGATTPLRE